MENSRKNNFDLFLLIFPPLIGITFSVLFGIYLYLLLPSLILGWFLPVYIGYWRGSIKLDSNVERLRSLSYLWVGVLSYAFFALLVMVVEPLGLEPPFDEIILFGLIFFLMPALIWSKIRRGLGELIEKEPREKFKEILDKSWVAAECLALSIYGFISLTYILIRYRWMTFESLTGSIVLIVVFIGSVLLLWKFSDNESEARKLSNKLEES